MRREDLFLVLMNERESEKLSEIQSDTFEHARTYLEELYGQLRRLEDPLSDQARSVIEEINYIRDTIRFVFYRRTWKILTLSCKQVENYYQDKDEMRRMLSAEREMLEQVTAAILKCRECLLESRLDLNGSEPEVPAAVLPAAKGREESEDAPSLPYSLVRILSDVDPFMGMDGRIYHLGREDIATLPFKNADVLCGRNIALNIRPIK
ncbi:MAG: hypothetical protein QMD46_02115 [Methanomicrobiales archaeon]|nr:hypothetical protein [Methanomicrobiales archaeon]MDI6875235.1 hypothetical protein [Methanomicrobiales archaeon]